MNASLDDIKTYLDSHIEAELVQLESELSVTIPRIASEDTADLTDRQYPSLEILPDSTNVVYIHPEGPADRDAWDVHSISLLLTMSGQDSKSVEYSLLYYRRAWVRIIRDDNTFGGLFNYVKLRQTQYWPMVQSQKTRKVLQTMRQNIEVRKYQTS